MLDIPSLDNWATPPHHRAGLRQADQIVATAAIHRGQDQPRSLGAVQDGSGPTLPVELGDGRVASLGEYLCATRTDGLLVLRGDQIVLERYFGDFTPRATHIVMSISKSFAGMVAGILVHRGLLNPADPVISYVPELAGGAWADATVQQLLDMTAAPAYDMSYLDPDAEVHAGDRAAGWRPLRPGDTVGTRAFLSGVRGAGSHGSSFQYCSGTTDVLAWVLERASGIDYRTLLEDLVWTRIGAEADAWITVDSAGTPYACAGMGMRLRDLARFGRLILEDGFRDGSPAIPETWIRRTREGGEFSTSDEVETLPAGTYKNQWWIPANENGSFYAVGIFGQFLWLDPTNDVVIAKFSAEDTPLVDEAQAAAVLHALSNAAALQRHSSSPSPFTQEV